MSDFDDQLRAAGERVRRRAEELAASRTPTPDDLTTDDLDAGHGWRRALVAVAALAIIGGGVAAIAIVADGANGDDVSVVDTAPGSAPIATSPSTSAAPDPTSPTSTEPPSTSEPSMPDPSTTVADDGPAALTRPIFDPAVCTTLTAWEGESSAVADFTLFARPSAVPVPIQVIGDPVDGEAKPAALVMRHFDRNDEDRAATETVIINGTEVQLQTSTNGNGQATWRLADGSQGYLRSRGLVRDQIVGIVTGLAPRPGDAQIPGFDYVPDPAADGRLELVAEQMDTSVTLGPAAGSRCDVDGSERWYRVTVLDGDPVGRFAAVLDRPVPLSVDVRGGQVVIVEGTPDPAAPTAADLVDADADFWLELRSRPSVEGPPDAPRSVVEGQDVIARLEPVASDRGVGYLTLRVDVTDGVPFLEVESTGVEFDPAAVYKEILIDGRLRSRTSAPGGTLSGVRLADDVPTEPFTVTVRTVDADGQVLQTTPEVTLELLP